MKKLAVLAFALLFATPVIADDPPPRIDDREAAKPVRLKDLVNVAQSIIPPLIPNLPEDQADCVVVCSDEFDRCLADCGDDDQCSIRCSGAFAACRRGCSGRTPPRDGPSCTRIRIGNTIWYLC